MSFIIEEADLEPLEPHKIREASWKELKKMSKALAINSLDYNEAFQLFRKWLDDRLLYHDQVKPMLYYTIMSNIIKHRKVLIGSSYQDPRVPVLIYMPSGSGKYIILEALFEINNTALYLDSIKYSSLSIISSGIPGKLYFCKTYFSVPFSKLFPFLNNPILLCEFF